MSRAVETLAALRKLPIAQLDEITNGRGVMILAPHSDDESLGCGGLIAEACAHRQPPVVVIVTDGTGSHPSSPSYPPERLRLLREQEARRAVTTLGLPPERLHFLRLRDTATPQCGKEFDAAVTTIVQLMKAYECQIICAPWLHEPHCDHEAAQIMARAAADAGQATVLSYLVWGWMLPEDTELPDDSIHGWRLDIALHTPLKRRAIGSHASQYTDLIKDDPAGFRIPAELLGQIADWPYEVLIRSQ